MEPDYDELFTHARHVATLLATLYRDVAGEELDLETAIKHYPLIAVGLAAGLGTLGGLWLGRKLSPQLPPPSRPGPLDRLEQYLPIPLDRVMDFIPETTIEGVTDVAREWMGTVLEPRIKEVTDGPFGNLVRYAIERFEDRGPQGS
jgi:hypothetical protein